VHVSDLTGADVKATTPASIRSVVKESLSKLETIPDLILIHNPYVPEKGKIAEFYQILESLVEDGTLKGTSLGVSNFRPQDLKAVLDVAKIKPVINRESGRISFCCES
jgi:diketogulonate reductase-like aldo/keto reductase